MDNEIIFRILLLLLLIGFVANRAYYTRKFGQPDVESIRARDGKVAPMAANLLAILAMLSTIIYLINPAWVSWAALPLPTWLRWFGVGLALFGFILLQRAHRALGKNWSDHPRVMEEQTLVTEGPYRRICHPIYTAFLMIMGATLFISANWFIGLAWTGMTAVEVVSRIQVEEEMMLDQFGDQYRDYMVNTGRLLPRLFASK